MELHMEMALHNTISQGKPTWASTDQRLAKRLYSDVGTYMEIDCAF